MPPPGPDCSYCALHKPPAGGGHQYVRGFDHRPVTDEIASQIRTHSKKWRTHGLPWFFNEDLLVYAEIMRGDSEWRRRWHWNDDWLYDAKTFGTSQVDYNAWFTELEQKLSEPDPVFTLLTLCWKWRHAGGGPAAGPLNVRCVSRMHTATPYSMSNMSQANPFMITAVGGLQNLDKEVCVEKMFTQR